MIVLTDHFLRDLGTELFVACGAPRDEAAIVSHELVEASLMGLDSHGVVRFIQYAEEALSGKVKPGAPLRVVKETPTTALIDCGFNFGPVTAVRMVEIACTKAMEASTACVVSQNSHHVSRLGAYVQRIAEQGLFAFATCNSSKHGHWVVPWGGREGRLATNPVAYAAPTSGYPVVLDMSTAAISEGKIRVLMNEGKPVPPGYIQDAQGVGTTDPRAFYGPPKGTILPFGEAQGYKGFGLSLLTEILGGVLAGMASSEDNAYINGLSVIALNPDAFCGRDRFVELMDDLCAYQTSAATSQGFNEVVMPGTYDFRTRAGRLAEGIPVDDTTWQQIQETAERLGVAIPA